MSLTDKVYNVSLHIFQIIPTPLAVREWFNKLGFVPGSVDIRNRRMKWVLILSCESSRKILFVYSDFYLIISWLIPREHAHWPLLLYPVTEELQRGFAH